MLDQYGKELPDDLVFVPDINELNEAEIGLILQADWYDLGFNGKNSIVVSKSKVNELTSDLLNVADTYSHRELEEASPKIVQNFSKRWNLDDGFYYA